MPLNVAVTVGAIVLPFVIFALALAWAQQQTRGISSR